MIATAFCESAELETVAGIHAAEDEYRMALIAPDQLRSYGASTTNYAELGDDEAKGEGYESGGVRISGRKALRGPSGYVHAFDPVTIGPNATIQAAGALVYNATKGGRACSVHKFAQVRGVRGGDLVISPKTAAKR